MQCSLTILLYILHKNTKRAHHLRIHSHTHTHWLTHSHTLSHRQTSSPDKKESTHTSTKYSQGSLPDTEKEHTLATTQWRTCTRPYIRACTCSPDEHTLVVSHPPHGHVDLIGYGKNVWRKFTQLPVHVQLHLVAGVETIDRLVGIDCGEDGTNVGLLKGGKGGRREGGGEEGKEGRREQRERGREGGRRERERQRERERRESTPDSSAACTYMYTYQRFLWGGFYSNNACKARTKFL